MKFIHSVMAVVFVVVLASFAVVPMAQAEERVCRGVIGATTVDNLRVPDGASCTLSGTRVEGTIVVGTNAALTAYRIAVKGNIQAEGARLVRVYSGSRVDGSVQIKQGGSATLDRVVIGSDLQFDANRSAVRATYNRVGGSLQAMSNTGGVTLRYNTMNGNLQCKSNQPAPVGIGNRATSKEDQCARL